MGCEGEKIGSCVDATTRVGSREAGTERLRAGFAIAELKDRSFCVMVNFDASGWLKGAVVEGFFDAEEAVLQRQV